MSVHSVLPGLPPAYNLLLGSNSRSAKSATFAKEPPEKTFPEADVDQATSARVGDVAENAAASREAPGGLFQSTLEQARRQNRATAGNSTSGNSGSLGGQTSRAIALYQRIKQYGNNEPSTSALLKSWNNIMQGGQEADSAAAAFAQALSQNEALGSESGVLDLTA
jgi:hypothetical protein